jgi:hypothetical protein
MWCPAQPRDRAAAHFEIDQIYSGRFSANLLNCRPVALVSDTDS